MKKKVRKRLRRWYWQKWCFGAVLRYFQRMYEHKEPPKYPTQPDWLPREGWRLYLNTWHMMNQCQAYPEALEWAYGIAHRDLRLTMPAKGKVSSKTIQVKRIDL